MSTKITMDFKITHRHDNFYLHNERTTAMSWRLSDIELLIILVKGARIEKNSSQVIVEPHKAI